MRLLEQDCYLNRKLVHGLSTRVVDPLSSGGCFVRSVEQDSYLGTELVCVLNT